MGASLEIKRAWPIINIVFLLVFAAINIFLFLFIVPKFELIYADTEPGMPLPVATGFIIAARVTLALIALAWPIVGIFMFQRSPQAAIWIINLGNLYFFLLIGVTVIALFMPLAGGFIVGVSDTPLVSAVASH